MKNEKGSIVVWLLVGVLLFAALGMAMMRGSRTSAVSLSQEQAKAYANQLISYGQELKSAVKRLELRGCGVSKISFETTAVGYNYTNASAPDDGSCDVFDARGGGMNWPAIPRAMLDPAMEAGNANFGVPFFTGMAGVVGLGKDCANDSCSELLLLVADIQKTVCEEINRKFSLPPPGTESITNYSPHDVPPILFQGSYTYINAGSVVGNDILALARQQTGCFQSETTGNPYVFFQVLLTR